MAKATTTPVEQAPVELKELSVEEIVEIIDKVDGTFADIGGSTKDWVEQAFLPALRERKVYLVTKQQ